jgi:hypothetical protein
MYDFVMMLTNSYKHLEMLNEESRILAGRRLFLTIRQSGNGMTSTVATKEEA